MNAVGLLRRLVFYDLKFEFALGVFGEHARRFRNAQQRVVFKTEAGIFAPFFGAFTAFGLCGSVCAIRTGRRYFLFIRRFHRFVLFSVQKNKGFEQMRGF